MKAMKRPRYLVRLDREDRWFRRLSTTNRLNADNAPPSVPTVQETSFKDILAMDDEEDPPGLTEEGYHKREERLRAIRMELEDQRRAERRAEMTPEELLDEDIEPLELRGSDLDLIRQWFDAVQDLNSAYLTASDYHLAREIYERLDMRVPDSITDRIRSGGDK